MKRWAVVVMLLAMVSSGHAQVKPSPTPIVPTRWIVVKPPPTGTITYVMTAPSMGNAGNCSAPILRPVSSAMTIRWRWSGPSTGMGSLAAMPGDTCRISVTAGAESLWVWAERQGIAGCDTVVAVSP